MDYKLILYFDENVNRGEYLSKLIKNVVEVFDKDKVIFYDFFFEGAVNRVEIKANYDFEHLIKKLATDRCRYFYEYPDKYSEDWYDEDLGE